MILKKHIFCVFCEIDTANIFCAEIHNIIFNEKRVLFKVFDLHLYDDDRMMQINRF